MLFLAWGSGRLAALVFGVSGAQLRLLHPAMDAFSLMSGTLLAVIPGALMGGLFALAWNALEGRMR